MKLVDANVLVYAYNSDAEHHVESRSWLDAALSGAATVGFSWVVLLAFVRLTTARGIFPAPVPVATATAQIREWLGQPPAQVVQPTARHGEVLAELLVAAGRGGNLVNDAHLAALAVEHRATVVTYDHDFERFPGVRWERPS